MAWKLQSIEKEKEKGMENGTYQKRGMRDEDRELQRKRKRENEKITFIISSFAFSLLPCVWDFKIDGRLAR